MDQRDGATDAGVCQSVFLRSHKFTMYSKLRKFTSLRYSVGQRFAQPLDNAFYDDE